MDRGGTVVGGRRSVEEDESYLLATTTGRGDLTVTTLFTRRTPWKVQGSGARSRFLSCQDRCPVGLCVSGWYRRRAVPPKICGERRRFSLGSFTGEEVFDAPGREVRVGGPGPGRAPWGTV